jgi:Helix-turn-helix domain
MTEAEAATLFGVGSDQLLTREEAATMLRVTPRTLINWANEDRGPRGAHVGARTVLYSKKEILEYLEACRPAPVSKPAKAPAVASPAVQAAVEAERRRATLILARCPGESYRAGALKAIRDRISLEEYDASLGDVRAFMPPLHRFVADFDRADRNAESVAQSILTARKLARDKQ